MGKVQRGRNWRWVICDACRRLGHPYGNVPNTVAVRLLQPYAPRSLAEISNKKKLQDALIEAARIVLNSVPKAEKPAPKPAPKVTAPRSSDTFYSSWEWKRVRYEALKLHGRRCQCCGWRPGDSDGHLVVDHIKPRRRYPELELDLSNLQVLCNDCNMGKGAAYEDDFRTLEVRHRATIQ